MTSSYNMRACLQQHARLTDAELALTLALARPCAFSEGHQIISSGRSCKRRSAAFRHFLT